MSGERISPIPKGLLEVEAAAYPIATEAAFALRLMSLDPTCKGATGQLWQTAESEWLRSFPGLRVEHATAVRDREWFDESSHAPRALTAWFRSLATRYFESRGPTFAPRLRSDRADPRWIVRLLPPDFLAAALWKDADRPIRIDDSAPQTSLDLREAGFAETHLHIGAGLEFGSHWIGTLFTLLDPHQKLDGFRSPGAAFGNGLRLADWLLRAAVVRQFLGEYLASIRSGGPRRFEPFVQARLEDEQIALGVAIVLPLRVAIRDVMAGQIDTTHNLSTIRGAFRRYCHAVAGYDTHATGGLGWLDPLAPYFPPHPMAGVSTELQFSAAALQESEHRDADPDFALAFWQTMRIRNIYYRHLTQRAMTTGLAWFVRYFDRIAAGRKTPLSDLAGIAANVSGAGRGLHYFEFRTSPPNRVDTARTYIETVFSALSQAPGLKEAGLVYHFIRHAGGGKTRGLPHAHGRDTNANPRPATINLNPRGYRFQTYAADLRKQAVTVARLLALHPHLLLQLRGIDLCTDELAVPIWAFVGTFRALRTVSERVSTHLSHYGRRVPPLRRTVHAGEDYPHLLTGLRIIGDTIRRLDLKPGDRLGHALALGFDPDRWAKTTGTSVLTRDIRLFDLAWEWDCRTRLKGSVLDASRVGFLDREIRNLSHKMFQEPLSPHDVSELADFLHEPVKLAQAGYPNGPVPNGNRIVSRAVKYLTDPEVFAAGSLPVAVDAAAEVRAVEEMQMWLRGEVATRGIAVEINPTSNYLIGNLGEWRKHPLFRMNPPEGGAVNPVPLVVGSDDPLVFATGLPEEYSVLERALDDAEVLKPMARRWLDEVRATGVKFRFTLAGSLDPIRPNRLSAMDDLLADIGKLFDNPAWASFDGNWGD